MKKFGFYGLFYTGKAYCKFKIKYSQTLEKNMPWPKKGAKAPSPAKKSSAKKAPPKAAPKAAPPAPEPVAVPEPVSAPEPISEPIVAAETSDPNDSIIPKFKKPPPKPKPQVSADTLNKMSKFMCSREGGGELSE